MKREADFIACGNHVVMGAKKDGTIWLHADKEFKGEDAIFCEEKI